MNTRSTRHSRALSIVVALLLGVLFSAEAAAGDPKLSFRTIRTEHFRIHYHQSLERTARVAATICEEVHETLSILFGWEVDGPTNVVITDSTDSANGSASVKGRPVMQLYATSPSSDSELIYHDYYLRALIIHEYTHIVHQHIHGGISRVINAIFGNVYLPNGVAPRWLVEGIAVVNETYETTQGRIRSSIYPMYLRTEAYEDKLLTLGEASNDTRAFLRGGHQYLYGALFVDYLRTRFGMEKLVDIFHLYGDSLIPWGLNRTFDEVLGVDLVTLYDEWIESVKAEALTVKEKLEQQELTVSTALTRDGEHKGQPLFAPDGRSILLPVANGHEDSAVFEIPLDGSAPKSLFLASVGSQLSMDRAGRIFYTRGAPYRNIYYFYDMFAAEYPYTEPRRVTFGARTRYGAVSPRGDRLALVRNRAGTSKLVLADDRGNELKTLIDSKPNDQVYSPVWSPDGRNLAVIVRRGPAMDLGLVNARTGAFRFLTRDHFFETNPVFTADGRYVVFCSDRTGINNIYGYELATGRLFQLTNVATGAFSPAVSPDGQKLAFLSYSTRGYDLHLTRFRLREPLPAVRDRVPSGDPGPSPKPMAIGSEPYNPLPTLLPSYWDFKMSMDTDWNVTLRAVTALLDVVGRHNIGAELDYYIEENVFSGRLAYSYGGLVPGIHVGLSRQYVPRDSGFQVGRESSEWLQVTTTGSLSLSLPILGVDRSHRVSMGYNVTHAAPYKEPEFELDPADERPTVPSQFFRAGLSFSWSFSDVVSHPLGIGPHKGRSLSASVSLYHPVLGGDQTLTSLRYGWSEYLKIPWLEHHTLAVLFNGGVHVSDPPNQAAFSLGGFTQRNIVDVIWNNASGGDASLKGYPPNSIQGSHFHSLKLHYNFPIWFAEAAYGTIPVYLKRIQGKFFSENAVIAYDEIDRDDWYSSLGAEVNWILVFGYYQTMSITTGYAYGFMEGGIHEVILSLSGGF